jgi:hypothetical protein
MHHRCECLCTTGLSPPSILVVETPHHLGYRRSPLHAVKTTSAAQTSEVLFVLWSWILYCGVLSVRAKRKRPLSLGTPNDVIR